MAQKKAAECKGKIVPHPSLACFKPAWRTATSVKNVFYFAVFCLGKKEKTKVKAGWRTAVSVKNIFYLAGSFFSEN